MDNVVGLCDIYERPQVKPMIFLPSQYRPWRAFNQFCENLPASVRSPASLISMEPSIYAALVAINDIYDRPPPLVVSRVYRGGKTTMMRAIFDRLLSSPDQYYPIIISASYPFKLRDGEPHTAALVRLIAYALTDNHKASDDINRFHCSESELLIRLAEISSSTGRKVVLMIDDLHKLSLPLDEDASCWLTTFFLDRDLRYLVYSAPGPFM